MLEIAELHKALIASWKIYTSSTPEEWSDQNATRGQCVSMALVVQRYIGGNLQRLTTVYMGYRESHYRNILATGVVVDLTREQYPPHQELVVTDVNLKGFKTVYVKRLKDPETQHRYDLLLRRVASKLGS